MTSKSHACEAAGCSFCTLEKLIFSLFETATSSQFKALGVNTTGIRSLLSTLDPNEIQNQIAALLTIDDEYDIPTERPKYLNEAVWQLIKDGDSTELAHAFRMSRISYIGCLLSIDDSLFLLAKGDFSNALLTYGHANLFFGETIGRGYAAFGKGSLHHAARAGAIRKTANDSDGKQAIKRQVQECWKDWQEHPERYRGKAAFARDMLDKYEELRSQVVIERWCREWESELS